MEVIKTKSCATPHLLQVAYRLNADRSASHRSSKWRLILDEQWTGRGARSLSLRPPPHARAPFRALLSLCLQLQPPSSVGAREEATSVHALRARRKRRWARAQLEDGWRVLQSSIPLSSSLFITATTKASLQWTKKGRAILDCVNCTSVVQCDILCGVEWRDAPAASPIPRLRPPRFRATAELSQLFQ